MACEAQTSRPRWPARLRRALLLPVAIAATAALTACAPMPVADDEGNATFAREAIKLLLGRPARGTAEVKVVADIANTLGRGVATKMLMEETEFVDTWADLIGDLLRLQREGGNQLAGADKTCWGSPSSAWSAPDPRIARWVRDNGPTAAGPEADGTQRPENWNMTDLLRSSIALHDLSPFYRAYLFTLTMRRAVPKVAPWVDFERRAETAQRFLRVYLNRDVTCMRCHNPTYSASNVPATPTKPEWTRLWTVPGHADKAVLGNYYDAGTILARLHPILRGDVRKPAGTASGFGARPWGMAGQCATDTENHEPDNVPVPTAVPPLETTHEGFQAVDVNSPEQNPNAGFGSINGPNSASNNPVAALWELETALRNGINGLKNGYTRFDPTAANMTPALDKYCILDPILTKYSCKSCHSPGYSQTGPAGGLNLSVSDPGSQLVNKQPTGAHSQPAINNRAVPGCFQQGSPNVIDNTTCSKGSEIWSRVVSTGQIIVMPQSGHSAEVENAVREWIASGAEHMDANHCNNSPQPDVDPDEGFAFLTASNLVDGIFMAATGHRLTIDHGYSRSELQRDMLWNLTEFEFLPNWSLQAVLNRILTSTWYARRAPETSTRDTAYKLPPILDPWVVTEPADPSPIPEHRYNGEGELVDRFRVSTLLRHVAAALGWEKPRRFPGGGYPSALASDLGQYLSPGNPGFRGINFQSLLALEAETGLCDKNTRVALNATTGAPAPDWIDTLVDRIVTFNAANSTHPITYGEAWMMLKDRLIQDPSINTLRPSGLSSASPTEFAALDAFLKKKIGVASPYMSATAFYTPATLNDGLRGLCGVLAKTPQFLLTNIAPRSYSPTTMPSAPRFGFDVCLPGEPCGYAQICQYWGQKLSSMGHPITCLNNNLTPDRWVIFDDTPGERSSGAPSSGYDWLVLTRQATEAPARLQLSSPPADGGPVRNQQQTGDAARPAETPAAPLARAPQFDLIKGVRIRQREPLKGLGRLSQRFATLCPGSLCGFVPRPSSNIARCVANPRDNNCLTSFALCDPRSERGANSCGALPADFRNSGVLALWAEGAGVETAVSATLLRSGEERWHPLLPGTRLLAGDLIYLPLQASLRLRVDNVVFGDTGIEERQIAGLNGHLLAITGPSAEKLLDRKPARGALSPAELIRGVQSGAFQSRVMTPRDWERSLGYAVRAEHARTQTEKEIRELNSHFESLHRGFPTKKPK